MRETYGYRSAQQVPVRTRFLTRAFRFWLASTLNEIARIRLGYRHIPVRNRKSARCASISVLPAPGPAVRARFRPISFAAASALGSRDRPSAGDHCSAPNHSGRSASFASMASNIRSTALRHRVDQRVVIHARHRANVPSRLAAEFEPADGKRRGRFVPRRLYCPSSTSWLLPSTALIVSVVGLGEFVVFDVVRVRKGRSSS